jgi:L-asparaginase II
VEAIRVSVRRGSVVEAVHRVHAIAFHNGAVVAEAGEPGLVAFYRSAAKPIQVLELIRARPDLDAELVAIACASHRAEPAQLEAAERLLREAGATESQLECGPQEGRVPEPLYHNCSGKHAGMLAACAARGWPADGYRLAQHPLQRAILADVGAAAGAEAREIPTAIDGCGVVTFALPLERMALSFVQLAELEGGLRALDAMRGHPELIGGAGSLDTELMRAAPGWAAKGGAEGLFCAVSADRVGIALKCEDGAFRALRPALARFLGVLGFDPGLGETPITNSRGEVVGELSC